MSQGATKNTPSEWFLTLLIIFQNWSQVAVVCTWYLARLLSEVILAMLFSKLSVKHSWLMCRTLYSLILRSKISLGALFQSSYNNWFILFNSVSLTPEVTTGVWWLTSYYQISMISESHINFSIHKGSSWIKSHDRFTWKHTSIPSVSGLPRAAAAVNVSVGKNLNRIA